MSFGTDLKESFIECANSKKKVKRKQPLKKIPEYMWMGMEAIELAKAEVARHFVPDDLSRG